MTERLFEFESGIEITEADVERNPERLQEYIQQQVRKIAAGEPVWLRVDFNQENSAVGKTLHYFFKGSHCGYLNHLYGEGSSIWATGMPPNFGDTLLNRWGKPIEDIERAKKLIEANGQRRWELGRQHRIFLDLYDVPNEEEVHPS